MEKFPSGLEILEEAEKQSLSKDINELHSLTYELMKRYRDEYYRAKIELFFSRKSLSFLDKKTKLMLAREMLMPVVVRHKNKEIQMQYSNFMEEASRRISQTFQAISGNLAELCIERKLQEKGLKPVVHYLRRVNHTDFTFYYPNHQKVDKQHRVEVKNVKLRERGVRGLAFDGDSMFGFFNDPAEFTKNNIDLIDEHCKESGGYCYVPPNIIKALEGKIKEKRFRSNQYFDVDMKHFVKSGSI